MSEDTLMLFSKIWLVVVVGHKYGEPSETYS